MHEQPITDNTKHQKSRPQTEVFFYFKTKMIKIAEEDSHGEADVP